MGDVEPYDRPHGLFRAVVRTAGGRVSLGVFVSRAAAIAAIVDATAGDFSPVGPLYYRFDTISDIGQYNSGTSK